MNKRYTIAFPFCLLFVFGLYTIFYINILVYDQGEIPLSYKQFLLENTTGGNRILIDSGSNGYHSVDGETLEKLTGRPIIILSDHASVHLPDKLYRLRKFSKSGDLIILPLEWKYYISELERDHIEHSIMESSHYFQSLPLHQQIYRVFDTPLSIVAHHIAQGHFLKRDDIEDDINQLEYHSHYSFFKNQCGGVDAEAVLSDKTNPKTFKDTCDDYVLNYFKEGVPEIGTAFHKSIKLMDEIQQTGVRVILIPPTVVGDDCYTQYQDNLTRFLHDLENELQKHNISYLGTPEYFKMSSIHFLNTPFHILPSSRTEYSIRLYELLSKAHALDNPQPSYDFRQYVAQILIEKKHQLMRKMILHLKPWNGGRISMGRNKQKNKIVLETGWNQPEENDVWSEGTISIITFKPAHKILNAKHIHLEANYFLNAEETNVSLNGTQITSQDFSKNTTILLPHSLASYVDSNGLIRLKLTHTNPQRPADHFDSPDRRLLKLQLTSISVDN